MTTEEPSGRAKGGIARREALSPQERKNIARRAAAARWGYKASHKGSFEEHFGTNVECYVLNDEQKTAVISQRGMAEAIGLSSRGNAIPRLLGTRAMADAVGAEVRQKFQNPLKFQWGTGGAGQPPTTIHGYDATLLIDLCKAVIAAQAAGKLQIRHAKIARQAHIIVSASAKLGIKQLVYALSGYDSTKEEIITAFKFYVRDEAREYEKEFPDQLYEQWYRLYQLPKPERNKPWKFKHLTIDQVYKPLARSSGKILDLTRLLRGQSGTRHKKLHQFLSEIGVKTLRTHLGQLLGIAQVSKDRTEYENHVENIFGDQPRLPL